MTVTQAPTARGLAGLVEYLETGRAPQGLFADDVFGDLNFPLWRLQATSASDLLAIRAELHPWPGQVRLERSDRTETGFVVALEERWEAGGRQWYCREFFRVDVLDGRIVALEVWCTGDWDPQVQRRHAEVVTLARR